MDCESVFPGTCEEDARASAMECWDDVTEEVKAQYFEKQRVMQQAYDEQMATIALE